MRQLLTALFFLTQLYGCPRSADTDVIFAQEAEACPGKEYGTPSDIHTQPSDTSVSPLQAKEKAGKIISGTRSAADKSFQVTEKVTPAVRYTRMICPVSGKGDFYDGNKIRL